MMNIPSKNLFTNINPRKNKKTGMRFGDFKKIRDKIAPMMARIPGARLAATDVVISGDRNGNIRNPQANAHKPPMSA